MTADEIEEDRSLEDILSELNKQALKHKQARDTYNSNASILADKRDALRAKSRALSSEANLCKKRRDEASLTGRELKAKRDEWNDRVSMMRASGGLGDITEAKTQATSFHNQAQKEFQKSDNFHLKMKELYEEADKLREEADTCHSQFLDLKKAADLEHEKYIAAIRRINEIKDDPYFDLRLLSEDRSSRPAPRCRASRRTRPRSSS